jgi:hypothetical protein
VRAARISVLVLLIVAVSVLTASLQSVPLTLTLPYLLPLLNCSLDLRASSPLYTHTHARTCNAVNRYLTPTLLAIIPREYSQWVPVVLGWITKTIAMSIAWYIQSIVSAAASALKGGLMMARALYDLLVHHQINVFGLLPKDHKDSQVDEIFSYVFAAAGFYSQYRLGFRLPFPFKLLLWPFEVAECYIRWSITNRTK